MSSWRRWNNALHRDVGYVIFALTLAYGISGVAVNHTADWNPNYAQQKEVVALGPVQGEETPALQQEVMRRLGLGEAPKTVFRPDPETIQLLYEGRTYTVDLPTGQGIVESVRRRPVLFELNQLHLNAPKKAWTWFADAYALSLVFVAVSGLFVLKGKRGITGRGAWLTLLGALVPAGYWIWYQYF